MSSTFQEAIEALEGIRIRKKPGGEKLARKLCGEYRGVIPTGKTSTEFIRHELRRSLYGKIESNS